MAAETIREFLVALGFKVDQPTLKKFEDTITAATFKANVLADAFVGMAKAISENIQRATGDLENLYYTSIRVGSSATNLKALTQASQDFGVSAEEALSNIDALAKALRTDPGTEAFINHLGVKTRKANGELRDTVQVANDLGRALANKPDFLANQLAELVGITYKFQKMIRDPGWIQDLEKHQKLLGSGYDDASRKAAQLEQQWRELGDRWDGIKKRFEVNVFGPLLEYTEQFENWMGEHSPQITYYWDTLTDAVKRYSNAIGVVVKSPGVQGALEYVETGLKGALHFLQDKGVLNYIGTGLKGDLDFVLDKLGVRKQFYEELNKTPQSPIGRIGPDGRPLGIRNNNPGNLEYRGQPGAVRAGGGPFERRFAAFRTPGEGLDAMARQLELDFGRGMTTLNALITKYAPPEENDTAAYIADVAAKMHTTGRTPLNLSDPALLSSLMNAMITHENISNPYRPDDVRAAAQGAIGGSSVNVTQNNTININGSKDPAQTKQAVTDALYDYHRKATRNLAPATQ